MDDLRQRFEAIPFDQKSRGMTDIARRAGLGRESLYKALSPNGNPELATVIKVMEALGLKLHVRAG